jgi:hypothetical protein
MYRQSVTHNNGYPPIPANVEAEINLHEQGYGDRSHDRSRTSLLGQSSSRGIHTGYYGADPRQLQNPDGLASDTSGANYAKSGTSHRTPSLVRAKSSYLVEEQLTDLQGKMDPRHQNHWKFDLKCLLVDWI